MVNNSSIQPVKDEYGSMLENTSTIKEKIDDFFFWISPTLYRWFKLNLRPLIKGMPEVRKHIKCNYNNNELYINTKRISWSFDDYMLYDIIPGVCKSLKEQGIVHFDEDRIKVLDSLISMCEEYKKLDEFDCPIVNEYEDRIVTKTEDGTRYEFKAKEGMEEEYNNRRKEWLDWHKNASENMEKIRKDVFVLLSDNIQRMWR